jgi:hypothetical protein
MIYSSVDNSVPIQQGDIFRDIPRVDFSLRQMVVVDEDESPRVAAWTDLMQEGTNVFTGILPIIRVTAVVITQNCDAATEDFISLCQIEPYLNVIGQEREPKTPAKWASLIARQSRQSLRAFYIYAHKFFDMKG